MPVGLAAEPARPRGMPTYQGRAFQIDLEEDAETAIGARVWRSSYLLARYLEVAPELVAGKSVVELGAGCGLVGMAAAELGAATVLLTDLAGVLPRVERFDRGGIEPFELFRSEFGQNSWNPKRTTDKILPKFSTFS